MSQRAQPAADAAPSDRLGYIQGLRAIAVLAVIVFHAGLPVPGGFLGVDVFFVISGFVITAMLAREWARTGTVAFRHFYARRFRRLTPALAVLVAVVVLASLVLQSPLGSQQITARTGIGALLLSANIVIAKSTGGYFDAPAATNPLLNTWSLSVEEQFYLIFPLLLFIAWKLGRRWGARLVTTAVIITAVGGVSFIIAMAQARGHKVSALPAALGGFYGPVTRAWEFAVGALLALVIAKVALRPGRVTAAVLGLLGAAAIAIPLWAVNGRTPWPGPWTVLPVAGTVAVLIAGLRARGLTSRALSTRPMVAIGNISYSWYLWHWPFIVFAILIWPNHQYIALLAALASLVPSLISYRWIEQPIRNLRNVPVHRMTAIIAATIVPPVVLALGLSVAADHGFWIPRVQRFIAATAPMHVGNRSGCNTSTAPSARKPGTCVWHAADTGTPVYLVGDSHADHYTEAVIAATGALGSPLTIATANSCPFYDTYLLDITNKHSPCHQFVVRTLHWLTQQPPGLVIISTSSTYWNSDLFAAGPTPGTVSFDKAAKRAALQAGLESAVRTLQASGHKVLLVQDTPYFPAPYSSDPHQYSVWDIATGRIPDQGMPQAVADDNEHAARAGFAAVAASTGASLADFRSVLCPNQVCPTILDGTYLYRDHGHLSVAGTKKLDGAFTAFLTPLLTGTS